VRAIGALYLKKKRLKISNLKHKKIKVEYGPPKNPTQGKIDFVKEAKNRLNLDCYSIEDLEIEKVEHIPPELYNQTDRSKMPPHYLCAGSIGVRFFNPKGENASLCLAVFHHKLVHQNLWMWGWNFDRSEIAEYKIPLHDEISLDTPLSVTFTIGENVIRKEFKKKM